MSQLASRERAGRRSRRIAISLALTCLGAGLLAAPAEATFHLEMVNEVMLASASGDTGVQFVELLDNGGTEELFTPVFAPYKLVVYDAAGNQLGEQTLNPSGLRAAAAANREYLISTPAVDASFGVTGDEKLAVSLPTTAGQVCFAGNEPAPHPVSCMTYGTITNPVATNSSGTGTVNGPVPPNGESDQRQADGTVVAALPTPGAPNGSATPPGHVGKPIEERVSLTGAASRRATLRFTVLAGPDAPALEQLAVRLPRGVRFKRKHLARHVKVEGTGGAPLGFSARVVHRVLIVTLTSAATEVSVRVESRGLAVEKRLARRVKRHRVKSLRLVVTVTDTQGKSTVFVSRLKPA